VRVEELADGEMRRGGVGMFRFDRESKLLGLRLFER
jgi:hypothetical protein